MRHATPVSAPDDVLAVHDLRVTYRTRAGAVQAVKGVSFAIAPGRLLSVVGESGSGKSSLALAVLGALGGEASVTGEARYRGDDLLQMSPRASGFPTNGLSFGIVPSRLMRTTLPRFEAIACAGSKRMRSPDVMNSVRSRPKTIR